VNQVEVILQHFCLRAFAAPLNTHDYELVHLQLPDNFGKETNIAPSVRVGCFKVPLAQSLYSRRDCCAAE
jgi:hypothetical protein